MAETGSMTFSYASEPSEGDTRAGKVYDWETNTWKDGEIKSPSSSDTGSTSEIDTVGGMSTDEITSQASNIMNSGNSSDNSIPSNKANNAYSDTEIRTLEGDLELRPSKSSIRLNIADTVKLSGLGKYLSGLYYVSEITRTISSDGYTQSVKVIKTGFGSSLKEQQTNVVQTGLIKRE